MNRRIFLKEEDLEISHTKGSGPGGQNRNKRMTAVRVRHIPTGLVVIASERRSQGQNLEAALERLEAKLNALYHRPTPRVATKKSRAVQRKRLQEKKHRGTIKSGRSRYSGSDGE